MVFDVERNETHEYILGPIWSYEEPAEEDLPIEPGVEEPAIETAVEEPAIETAVDKPPIETPVDKPRMTRAERREARRKREEKEKEKMQKKRLEELTKQTKDWENNKHKREAERAAARAAAVKVSATVEKVVTDSSPAGYAETVDTRLPFTPQKSETGGVLKYNSFDERTKIRVTKDDGVTWNTGSITAWNDDLTRHKVAYNDGTQELIHFPRDPKKEQMPRYVIINNKPASSSRTYWGADTRMGGVVEETKDAKGNVVKKW